MKEYLISFECQSVGIEQSLNLHFEGNKFKSLPQFQLKDPLVKEKLETYLNSREVCWITNQIPSDCTDLATNCEVKILPFVSMSKFYPDLASFDDSNIAVKFKEKYHSMLLYTLFKMGINKRDAHSFFSEEFFDHCGYMHTDSLNRKNLMNSFEALGYSDQGKKLWVSLSRDNRSFHTDSHPTPYGFLKISSCISEILGLGTFSNTNFAPPDSLGYFKWAKYPGLEILLHEYGSFTWKMKNGNIIRSLSDFIDYYYLEVYPAVPFEVISKSYLGNYLGQSSREMEKYVSSIH